MNLGVRVTTGMNVGDDLRAGAVVVGLGIGNASPAELHALSKTKNTKKQKLAMNDFDVSIFSSILGLNFRRTKIFQPQRIRHPTSHTRRNKCVLVATIMGLSDLNRAERE